MVNRKLGRFYSRLAFEEWDGFEIGGPHQDFLLMVSEEGEANCEVYVFEPSLPGEAWNILVLKYTHSGQPGPSPAMKAQVELLANQLGAEVKEAFGD